MEPQPKVRPPTYQDVIDAPPHKVTEIIAGELHSQPRPASRHAFTGSGMGVKLGGAFQYGTGGPGGWWIIDEPELHLGDNILVPDLSGWRKETLPKYPVVTYFTIAPDWVCEILSPSTAGIDRVKKMPIYAQQGVRHIWLLDPDNRTLEVFELKDGAWMLHSGYRDDDKVVAPPFEAITMDLDDLWV